jgi:hypothetical protein
LLADESDAAHSAASSRNTTLWSLGSVVDQSVLRVLFVGIVTAVLAIWLAANAYGQSLGELHLKVSERGSSTPVAARVHLRTADNVLQKAPKSPFNTKGTPIYPPGLPHHFDHFTMPGEVQVQLTPGRYLINIEKGPEFRVEQRSLEIRAGTPETLNLQMQRWIDMKSFGWWSGETHIHRPVDDAALLVEAEDLHVAPLISHWNGNDSWGLRAVPRSPLSEVAEGRWVHLFSTEDERQGGGLLMLNLRSPFSPTLAGQYYDREYPSPVALMKRVRKQHKAWLDVEKPFWWDMPCWLASGQIDSIGIANNHMNRDQVRDDEAWGRPRDRESFPGIHGNGLYSQFVYYQALNAGFQIPPSAGSASGVLPNPVGYNRAYVLVEGKFSYARWWQELARGRVFVTNGPMLLVTANGRPPGEKFKIKGRRNAKLRIQLNVQVAGNDPIAAVEVIVNGNVIQRITNPGERVVPDPFMIERSSWFLVRAIAAVPETFRFASTGPFYVQVGTKPATVHRSSVDFFLSWIDQRIEDLRAGRAEKLLGKRLDDVLKPHLQARKVFEQLQRQSQ